MRQKMLLLAKWTLIIGLFFTISTFLIDYLVCKTASGNIYAKTQDIPNNKVGLLLGTGKHLQGGGLNLYYKYRIDAAVSLFNSGKIQYLLVSGDNSQKDYDEPSTIKSDLIKQGIPASRIFLDYAGFRTLDSVVRAKEIFQLNRFTVISQAFHNERAIFIANNKDLDVIGFNARDIQGVYGLKVKLREKAARVKMVLDLIIRKEPHFLGEPIPIK